MKRLYARFVLWLIRPALEERLRKREAARQAEPLRHKAVCGDRKSDPATCACQRVRWISAFESIEESRPEA